MISQKEALRLNNLLSAASDADQFFADAHLVFHGELEDCILDDRLLLSNIYDALGQHIKDQTLFSLRVGRLFDLAGGFFRDKDALYQSFRDQITVEHPLDINVLSKLIFYSYLCGQFSDLFKALKAYTNRPAAPAVDGLLVVIARTLITSASAIYSKLPSAFMPESTKALAQKSFPFSSYHTFINEVDRLVDESSRSLKIGLDGLRPDQPLKIAFMLDDFVFDRLNTLTKLYCDYFYLLTKYTNVRIHVRVFNIYRGFGVGRLPFVWDPPRGNLRDLFEFYYGSEEAATAEDIDFEYVKCHADKDYLNTVAETLSQVNPHVIATCLDRHNSILEQICYKLSPVAQIEIINSSSFIRHCDMLIPNGAVTAKRAARFKCASSPLPQIPYPVTRNFTKTLLGFPETSYLMTVVCKQFTRRLDSEGRSYMSEQFARTIAELSQSFPDIKVLFIGESQQMVEQWLHQSNAPIKSSSYSVIEFADDLRACMLACDLIVNPPISGGGRSIALALTDRKPVLIFAGADAANFVPKSNICLNMVDFALKSADYINKGPGFVETYTSETGVSQFSDAYNAHAVEQFEKAMREAYRLGRARLAAALD